MASKHAVEKKAIISDGRTHCISDKGLTASMIKDSLYQ